MTYDVRRYRARYPFDLLLAFSRDLLDGMQRMDDVGGDLVVAGGGRVLLVRHPDLIRSILIDLNADMVKARGIRLLKVMVGEGLLSSEIPLHTRQRKLVLPTFHHQRLRAYGATMVRRTDAMARAWREGEPFDVATAMNHLALGIVGETLFGSDVSDETERIHRAMVIGMAAFDQSQFPGADRLMGLPLPAARRARHARAEVDAVVYGLIHERRQNRQATHDDLLQMLLDAQDEDTGLGMTDEEVRDEAVTLLLAGHETTANALAWTWAFLAEHPDVEARLHAEVDALGRPPTFDDLPRLGYTRQVLAESMRLRPPAWTVGRQTVRDLSLDGVPVRKGTALLFSPLHLHRDPRFWDDPERFDPDRFAPEAKTSRHKFAYLPFSAGRRGCIGEQFAWAEGVLVLAAVAQRWQLALATPVPPPHGSVTLRPSGPVSMIPVSRDRV